MESLTAKWCAVFLGKEICANSLPEILVDALRYLEGHSTGTLERLSRVTRRKRNMVSRSRSGLYPGWPDLADHARPVAPYWYVGTNYSRRDVERILRLAGRAAGSSFMFIELKGRDACELPPLLSLL
jgi:hypothetical protein